MILAIALGGVLGTLARYALAGAIQTAGGGTFPYGTLVVNVLGSLLLGLVMGVAEGSQMSAATRATLTVGFAGAFTTFSTFSYETIVLLRERAYPRALLYTFGSVTLGLAAVALGLLLASALRK